MLLSAMIENNDFAEKEKIMSSVRHILIFFLAVWGLFLHELSAAVFPFPQNSVYAHGTLPTTVDSDAVQSAYSTWLSAYYEESGDLARVKFDDPTYTVSEGIAYGMLIMVYMDNAANDTQGKFDKLWHYYNTFPDANGLMHWKINGFSSVAQQNAATDAELDAALALIMASEQWNDTAYLDAAKALIAKIRVHEVNANRYLKPGDVWDDKKNPSYFSIAALKLFAQVDTGYADFWNEVIVNSYSLIAASANGATGLVPDWCSESGDPLGTHFSYDAVRTPWRMAWAYLWFGDTEAYAVADVMSGWIKNDVSGDPSQIKDGYYLDGSVAGQWNNPAFVGGFTAAALVDSGYQVWLDAAYARLESFTGNESYYNKSLQVLYMLLAGGNMPDFRSVQQKQSIAPGVLMYLLDN